MSLFHKLTFRLATPPTRLRSLVCAPAIAPCRPCLLGSDQRQGDIMKLRNIVATLTLAVGSLGFAAVGQAAKFVDVEIGVAPPAERVEVVPAPREGYDYEKGHYVWNGSAYVWTDGQFIQYRD